jgi:hypothetical protein
MPLQVEQRQQIQRFLGLSDQQVEEAIGAVGTPADLDAKSAETYQAVQQLLQDAVLISAKYDKLAEGAGQDARKVADRAVLAADRAVLEEHLADDYSFATPYGETVDKQATINVMLSGTIRPRTIGEGGYAQRNPRFEQHDDTATLTTDLKMTATGLVEDPASHQVAERDVSGDYSQTQTFVFRKGRWQLLKTEMSGTPATPRKNFEFVGEKNVN